MKKILFIILILICLIIVGCNRNVKCEISEINGGIYFKEDTEDISHLKSIFDNDILGTSGCYLFKEYEELESFLNEYNLLLNEKLVFKYNTDFFEYNALIIYFCIDSSTGYKYNFNLYIKDNLLNLNINKYRNKHGNYSEIEVNRLFFIDLMKGKIMDTDEFKFFTDESN